MHNAGLNKHLKFEDLLGIYIIGGKVMMIETLFSVIVIS